jgi:tetratricopeptide (TPR) repeat protein
MTVVKTNKRAAWGSVVKRLVGYCGGLLAVLGAATAAYAVPEDPDAASYQKLQLVEDDLATVGVKLATLLKEYGEMDSTVRERRFTEQLTDAEILYLLADYTRASLLLYRLVDNEANHAHPSYDKSVYYLAESQYQLGNDLTAQKYFKELAALGDSEHLVASVERVITLSDRLGHWEGLEVYMEALAKRGPVPAEIVYIYAKSLLRQDRYAEAVEILEPIEEGGNWYFKGRYLLAVGYLQLGRYKASEKVFKGLVKNSSTYDDADMVRDLSSMNRGRILLEQGKTSESIDAYQNIKRTSSFFEEALYEITWTFIRKADVSVEVKERKQEYEKALRALEVILLSEMETRVTPEAQLLLGNILVRLERYEEAEEVFRQVINRYAPVWGRLHDLDEENRLPVQYYEEVAPSDVEAEQLLPPLVKEWVEEDQSVVKSLEVVKDLEVSRLWISESNELIEDLLGLLDSDQQASFFPALQDAQIRRMTLENSLVFLSKRLLSVERSLIQGELSAEQGEQLQKVLEERARLEPEYQKLPKDKEDYEGRVNAMRARVGVFEKQAYRLKWDIEEIRREIKSLQGYMRKTPGLLDTEGQQSFVEEIKALEAGVSGLEKEQSSLVREIVREKNLISVKPENEGGEGGLRAQYNRTLETERYILKSGEASIVGRRLEALKKIREYLSLIGGYSGELSQFKDFLATSMKHNARKVKAALLKQRNLVNGYTSNLKSQSGDAKRVVGELVEESVEVVERDVYDIVLRADLGMTDVAWAIKEAQTSEITQTLKKQSREVGVVDAEWSAVLE